MPKTIITEKDHPAVSADPTTWGARYVRVGWNKATQDVQVATCDIHSDIHEKLEFSDVPGLLVHLDLLGLERMIQALFRAREALLTD